MLFRISRILLFICLVVWGNAEEAAVTGTANAGAVPNLAPNPSNSTSKVGSATENATKKWDIDLEGPCKEDLKKYCPNVEHGAAKTFNCLLSKLDSWLEDVSLNISEKCNKNATDERMRRNPDADWEVDSSNFGEQTSLIQEYCQDDTTKFCPNGLVSDYAVLNCLRKPQFKPQLAPECSDAVTKAQIKQSQTINLDADLLGPCKADLKSLPECRNGGTIGWHKACLRKNVRTVTAQCQTALFNTEAIDNEDLRFHAKTLNSCKDELPNCKDAHFGRANMLMCLWEKSIHDAEFNKECKQNINGIVGGMVKDYRLDFNLRTTCAADINQHCSVEKQMVDSLPIHQVLQPSVGEASWSGAVIQCLKTHLDKLTSNGCQTEVKRVVSIHNELPDSDRAHASACQEDIAKYCAKAVNVHVCLRTRLANLTAGCRKTEIIQGQLEANSITMKPALKSQCQETIDKFCSDAGEDGETLECLRDSVSLKEMPQSCRDAILTEIKISDVDWHFNTGVVNYCGRDIDLLCSSPKEQEKKDTIGCLESNYQSVQDERCSRVLRRTVKLKFDNVTLDPHLMEACKPDIDESCKDIEPGHGRVFACLLRSQPAVECWEKVSALQRIKMGDIRVDLQASRACALSIDRWCDDTPHGQGRIWRCLQDHREKSEMETTCAEHVENYTQWMHYSYDLNPALSQWCENDVELCDADDGQRISCYIENLFAIGDDSCRYEVFSLTKQRIENLMLDPDINHMCRSEIDRLCPGIEGYKARQNCLLESYPKLGQECSGHVTVYMSYLSRDVRLNENLAKSCSSILQKYCALERKDDGHASLCLQHYQDHDDMDPICNDAIKAEQRKREWSIKFNPLMEETCTGDADNIRTKFCSDSKKSQINCLTENVKNVQDPECRKIIIKQLEMEANDFRAKPGMEEACRGDLSNYCGTVTAGAGRLRKCLIRRVDVLANDICKEMLLTIQATISNDDDIAQLMISNNCEHERQEFCPDASMHLSLCLQWHSDDYSFSPECHDFMKAIISANHTSSGSWEGALKVWMAQNQSFFDLYGNALVVFGALAIICVSVFTLSYWMMNKRFKKIGYTVEVPSG